MKHVILGSAFFMAFNVFSAEGNYKIDTSHGKVGFSVTHMGISDTEGKFKVFDGTITLAKKLTDSKIEANVNVDSINTEDSDRDKHLKSPDFFDAEHFKTMKFVSTAISGKEDNLSIKGKLTIRDVTKDVEFKGKLTKEVKDPWGNLRVGLSGATKIKRGDFGMKFNKVAEGISVVSDDVNISINVEGIKQK